MSSLTKNVLPILSACLAWSACAAEVPADIPALTPATQTAKWAVDWWMPRFESVKALAATGGCEVVFLGDSISHNWTNEKCGLPVWNKYFASGTYRALNAGFGGDRTEQVLWRLDHGQLDGCKAKAVCLMIGTNNTGHRPVAEEPPIDTILGVRAVIQKLAEKMPQARVVLLPIFPRGETVEDACRRRNDIVNKELVKLADGKRVIWLDFTDKFLTTDGRLLRETAPDFLHPVTPGYEIWANELMPVLDDIFAGKERIAARIGRVNASVLATAWPDGAIPTCRAENDAWLDRMLDVRRQIVRSGGTVDVLMLGGANVARWETEGAAELAELKKRHSVLNAGFEGDDTRHLLWQIRNGGLLDGYQAKLIVLKTGSSYEKRDYPDATVQAVRQILFAIQDKQPKAFVVHFGCLPRLKGPGTGDLPERDDALNSLMFLYDRDWYGFDRVQFVDLKDAFRRPDGTLDVTLFDKTGRHPAASAYRLWREAIEKYVK